MRPHFIVKALIKCLLFFGGIYLATRLVDFIFATVISHSVEDVTAFESCSSFDSKVRRGEKLLKDPSQFALEESKLPYLVESYRTSALARKVVKILTQPIDTPCRNLMRFGRTEPGGHDGHLVCMDVLPTKSRGDLQCLVYSFGVGYDFSFEDQIIKHDCEVHSFDPSMIFMDHVRGEGVVFHRLGLHDKDSDDYAPFLDGFVKEPQIWQVRTLHSILGSQGHENRSLSILKIDIEGTEWPFFEYLLFEQPKLLNRIDQFIVEWHVGAKQQRQIDKILALASYFRQCSGFSLVFADYWRRDSHMHCFLTTFINSKLAHGSFS